MVAIKKIHWKKIHKKVVPPKKILLYGKAVTWFVVGALLGLFFVASFAYIFLQQFYQGRVLPGVSVAGVNFGGKSQEYVANYFDQKNTAIGESTFTFLYDNTYATTSAKNLQLGYNSKLLAEQAVSIGRSTDIFSNISLAFQAYLTGIQLQPSYTFSEENLRNFLSDADKAIHTEPIDAQFSFTNGRATTFKLSKEGKDIDYDALSGIISNRIPYLVMLGKPQDTQIPIPIKIIEPKITTEKANDLGIKELIGVGTSLFQHSIASRIYNVELAANRLNGIIVKPGEEFSFDKALGDVSSFTGYKQAYVISGGHTVLGDGGGVCQVSTTMFRAILNAGLPVTERHAHDYRVGYYEEDGPPGIDATVYVPTVDLKFRNTTGHNILIQSVVDPSQLRLTFYFYGVKDGREVTMTTPVVSNVQPAPAPLYQDDPTDRKSVV